MFLPFHPQINCFRAAAKSLSGKGYRLCAKGGRMMRKRFVNCAHKLKGLCASYFKQVSRMFYVKKCGTANWVFSGAFGFN